MSDEILEAFAAESAEIFEGIEEALRDFDAGQAGAIDRLFRHVHTLKGSAGIVGLGRLESFAHAWESRLGKIRAGQACSGPDCIGVLFAMRGRAMSILGESEPTIGAEGSEAGGTAVGLRPEDQALLASFDASLAKAAQTASSSAQAAQDMAPASAGAASAGAAPAGAAPAGADSSREGGRGRAGGDARVPSAKLETILALASEVVVSLSNLGQSARATGSRSLVDELGAVEALAASLYRSVLDTRMVSFGDVAGRFSRAVEEIARDRGLRIRFELSGADTEIDKGLADRLAEPILHLVRNAADHGIEPPAEREAAGKSREGFVALRAKREAGLLYIRVEDDGRGIDSEAVRLRAVETGRLAADARPGAVELMDMLFETGFTLSSTVTKWSGRGVGLDAVKRAVTALRGTARIETHFGHGSAAILRLPMALSLVDGFVARVGELALLVPFEAASSCIEFDDAGSSGQSFRLVEVRGELLPSVDLSEFYGEGRRSGRRVLILLEEGGERSGLVVDEVAETVAAAVRPLDRNLADSPGIAGHATLGDGSIVLVLDCAELGSMAARSPISSGASPRSE